MGESGSVLPGAVVADPALVLLDVDIHLGGAFEVVSEALDAVQRAPPILRAPTRWTLSAAPQLPADAVPVENVAAGQSHRPSVGIADVARADVVDLLLGGCPAQRCEFGLGNRGSIGVQGLDVCGPFSVLGAVLLDLDDCADGDADDEESGDDAEDDEAGGEHAETGVPAGLVPAVAGQTGLGRVHAPVAGLAVIQERPARLPRARPHQQRTHNHAPVTHTTLYYYATGQ